MANIDDVFAAIPDAQAITVDDSVDFVIDSNLRVISIPVRGVVLGVEGDKDVNRVTFLMPKTYKGVDLSTFQIRVNYANANGEKSFFKVTETSVVNDQIRFIWIVSADAVAYMGNVEFVVRFVKLNGSTVVQELNTTLATAKSLTGLSVDSEITPDQREDLLAHFYSEIDTYSEQKKNEILGSIPSDYAQMSNDVDSLKQDLGEKGTALTDIQNKMSDSNSNDGFLLCDLNGNIVGHIASFEVWNDEPYNKKYGWGGHPYGNGKLPPYSKIAGILEADLLSVRGGKGRWNKDDTGNFKHGGHLFEGWNAEEDARLTFGIGTKNKDISWIQTFHAATQEGTDSGAYYCVTKVGSDIDNQGMNFMPSITQLRSLFSLKVGDNLSPNSKHIQKLVDTGELTDWEYNKTDMIPYGTMYFDYTKDKVRVYTRTGGWKYLKFEEEV